MASTICSRKASVKNNLKKSNGVVLVSSTRISSREVNTGGRCVLGGATFKLSFTSSSAEESESDSDSSSIAHSEESLEINILNETLVSLKVIKLDDILYVFNKG